MKQLERITLVDYFLYDCIDFDVEGDTGFLGANGAGKTALLDAIQIVMLAADGRSMHFNARRDAPRNARSLRDYCLGVCGQGDTAFHRKRANTYIDLVFRDKASGACVSAGVALTADKASQTHELQQLYIAPGIALSSVDHLRHLDDGDFVIPWREFRFVLERRCKEVGTTPVLTTHREVFTRDLLRDYLAGATETPNSNSFRSVFPRALRLTKDVESLDETLRTQVIEPRPIEVQAFRQQVTQWGEMRDEIARLKDRLERADEVLAKYVRVKRSLVRKDNLLALAAVFDAEVAGERLGQAEDELTEIETTSKTLQKTLEALRRKVANADETHTAAIAAREANPEYQQQAGHAGRLKDLMRTIDARRTAITQRLSSLRRALQLASGHPTLGDCRQDAAEADRILDHIERVIGVAETAPREDIHALATFVSAICTIAEKARADAEAVEREAVQGFALARAAAERASRGLPELPPSVHALQQVLSNLGIQSQPVCDLVSISDPAWQPVVETYLGPHVCALLVNEKRELDALDAYRGLQGDRRIYGVKLALPSRLRAWRAPGAGQYAAELIEGDPTAVKYLRGELGRVKLATSSAELLHGEKAISKDGMVAKGGGAERMKLLPADAWRIGRQDRNQANKRALDACQDAGIALADSQRAAKELRSLHAAFDGFFNAERWPQELERDWDEAITADAQRTRIEREISGAASIALQKLEAAVSEASQCVLKLRDKQEALQKESGALGSKLESLRGGIDNLRKCAELAAAAEREARTAKWYDAGEADRLRADFDSQQPDEANVRRSRINDAVSKANAAATNGQMEGWQLFCEYLRTFEISNHDIVSGEWERAYKFVVDERTRIADTELIQFEQASIAAYQAAVDSFRHDVARKLLEGFSVMREQVAQLNDVLKTAPPFSNSERYQFTCRPTDQHRALYDFLQRIRVQGAAEEDIFGGAGDIPPEFGVLLAEGASPDALVDSPLQDHRRFFAFDVQILQNGAPAGVLSKRFDHSSGGEHRTPLYVIFGAALAAAYGAAAGAPSGLMLLDEAFDHMDPQNVSAVTRYLRALGLQLVLAGADSSASALNGFLTTYYDVARYGSVVQTHGHKVIDGSWVCLESDDYLLHPEKVSGEILRLRDALGGDSGAIG